MKHRLWHAAGHQPAASDENGQLCDARRRVPPRRDRYRAWARLALRSAVGSAAATGTAVAVHALAGYFGWR